jgi:anti-sigma regulatory factor (Ser/Thr protein kinase)
VGASVEESAAWVLPSTPAAVSESRHRAAEFAAAAGASDEVTEAIALAVSETVTNVILHAYDGDDGEVSVSCRVDGDRFIVEVIDEGRGIAPRPDSPGIGHGLAIVGAVAQSLDFAPSRQNGRGTAVTMVFGPGPPPEEPPGLEVLCTLALETVADASAVDAVGDGVLRRVAAEVVDDPALSTWLCAAVPPAKPGTATWAALREGGARLVIHNPEVPRSPGGPGERLNLMWWVAIPLQKPDGTPAALWGFGGRAGGRSVPPDTVIRMFAEAARGDLVQPAERAMLRARLTAASR